MEKLFAVICHTLIYHFSVVNTSLIIKKKQKLYTPYSKMAAILEFFCFLVNEPFWPRSQA